MCNVRGYQILAFLMDTDFAVLHFCTIKYEKKVTFYERIVRNVWNMQSTIDKVHLNSKVFTKSCLKRTQIICNHISYLQLLYIMLWSHFTLTLPNV